MAATELLDEDDAAAMRCDTCGVQFTVPAALGERHDRVGRSVWCPNGHLIGSDFREPIGLALQRAQDLASELGTELATERARHRATLRVLVLERHRIMLGRCPCCDYEARGLGAHLRKSHPEYDTEGR